MAFGRNDFRPTFRDVMINNAAWYGDSDVYVDQARRITHADYLVESRRLASALARAGLRPQDRLGMLGMNSIDFLVLYGACQFAGFIASTVNFRLAPAEMEYVINNAEQKILVFESEFVDHVARIRDRLVTVERFICFGGKAPDWAESLSSFVSGGDPEGPDLPPPAPDDLVYLMYTSGTTGRPKGVMQEHYAQIEVARGIVQAMQMTSGDRTLLMMPLFHIGAKAVENAALWMSGSVHIHRAFDPAAILKTISEEKISVTHMAPVMIQALLEHPDLTQSDVSSLKGVLYSAAAMPMPVLRRALATFGPIFTQMYGQTEGAGTLLPAHAHKPDGDERDIRRLGSIGHAIPGIRWRALDDQGRDVPTGDPGELAYRGAATMRGYWNNAAATLATMGDGWLRTGDIGRIEEDGWIYLVDRKKDMIISGGENISSREVEEALLAHPDLAEAAVIGVPHDKWGEAVCAVIVTRAGAELAADDVIAHSRNLIAGYKRPQVVHFVDSLPKLVSGKISKIDLRKRFATPSRNKEIQE